ncbi:MAG TPA: prepilin peptidase [Mycobacteriales bacterium]|nr:prepilin peptidase [Mycobacteriales bacterium]
MPVAAGVLGLVIGSFLNVVARRLPRAESIVAPGSRCPACRHPIRARDSVPVISWLALEGRCRDCAAPISPRYPLVELLTGLLFAVLAVRFGTAAELPAYLYLAAAGVALTLIDLDVRRLPNALLTMAHCPHGCKCPSRDLLPDFQGSRRASARCRTPAGRLRGAVRAPRLGRGGGLHRQRRLGRQR